MLPGYAGMYRQKQWLWQAVCRLRLFVAFGVNGPDRIEFFDCWSGCIHAVALIQMKRALAGFLEGSLDARFFFTEDEYLHRNRGNGLSQFVHMRAAIDALEPVMQFMPEMVKNIQTDQLLVS